MQIHVIVIMLLHTWSTNKIHVANQINRSGNTLLIDWHTVIRTEKSKTIPGPAAHPRKNHYRGLPSPPRVTDASVLFNVFNGHDESGIWPNSLHQGLNLDNGVYGIRLRSLTVNRLICQKEKSVIFKTFSTVFTGWKKATRQATSFPASSRTRGKDYWGNPGNDVVRHRHPQRRVKSFHFFTPTD